MDEITVTINCPYHGKTEIINLPENDFQCKKCYIDEVKKEVENVYPQVGT